MKRLLLLLAVVAGGVVAAALTVPSQAASVNGATISRQTVNANLAAVGASSNYRCYIQAEALVESEGASGVEVGGVGSNGGFNGTYDTGFADNTVDQLIADQLVYQQLAQKGFHLTPGDLAVGQTSLDQRIDQTLTDAAQLGGTGSVPCGGQAEAVLSTMPSWFVADLTKAEAAEDVLEAHAAGYALTPGALAAYYSVHHSQFDTVCVSDIVVANSAQATSIRQAIVGGSSTFAAQAQANSLDTSTKSSGGSAGCAPLAGITLSSDLQHLAIGDVTQPISYEGNYLLLTITKRTPSSYGSVSSLVQSELLAAGQGRVQSDLTSALRHSNISADPRYGQVVPGSTALLSPPPSPPTSSLLSPTANVPGATTPSTG